MRRTWESCDNASSGYSHHGVRCHGSVQLTTLGLSRPITKQTSSAGVTVTTRTLAWLGSALAARANGNHYSTERCGTAEHGPLGSLGPMTRVTRPRPSGLRVVWRGRLLEEGWRGGDARERDVCGHGLYTIALAAATALLTVGASFE